MGFLMSRRIFPQANDCSVRCNSISSEQRGEKGVSSADVVEGIRTDLRLILNIFVAEILMFVEEE